MKIIKCSRLDYFSLCHNYGKSCGIMEIMENAVHVHTFVSFILISWANSEKKKKSNKLWNTQS